MTAPCEQVERLKRIERSVDSLDHVVNGNGAPGIRTDLAVMQNTQHDHGKRLGKIESLIWMTLLGIAGSVGVTLLGLVLKK